jgi:hypothetical protein
MEFSKMDFQDKIPQETFGFWMKTLLPILHPTGKIAKSTHETGMRG